MFVFLLIIIYLSFISLGLPDSLLGAAWPKMYLEFNVPLSYAGIISAIISLGTVISSLNSDRLTLKYSTGKVTAVSTLLTAISLFGFSISKTYLSLCLWSIPFGLGAGSVDASLNNYVALHYKSRHMSWLHCMWGIGAATGPYIMGYVLTNNLTWQNGYSFICLIQLILTIILFISLPIWNKTNKQEKIETKKQEAIKLIDIFKIKGTKEIFICFFSYCALEQTAGLWASTYLNLYKGVDVNTAASYASMFFIGITLGRAISGFLTMLFNDSQMIRLGQVIIILGIIVLFINASEIVSLVGFILIGLGCAPIYPCVIHSTPERFGADKSQAVIGMQMAFAYLGILFVPPLFGFIANNISVSLLPPFLLVFTILMVVSSELLNIKTRK